MKRFFSILIVVLLLTGYAFADAPLEKMKYDELVKLHKQIQLEIMSRPEWKSVVVQSGEWIVGEDIPAGTYSVNPTKNGGGYVSIWDKFDHLMYTQGIRHENDTIAKVRLENGCRIEVSSGSVVFAPPKGLDF